MKEPVIRYDIRAEVTVAYLLDEGWKLEDMLFRPNGLFKRNYHWDIESIGEIYLPNSNRKVLEIGINREGLYDRLPEDLFHAPLQEDEWQGGIEARTPKEVETSSRAFFIPFENEFFRLRILLEMEERNSLFETNAQLPDALLEGLWSFPDVFHPGEKSRLCMLMPILHRLRGDIEMIAEGIGSVMGDEIMIQSAGTMRYRAVAAPSMGASRLGVDLVLGGELRSMTPSNLVRIRPAEAGRLMDYLPGGRRIKAYEYLCSLFFPLENDVLCELWMPDGTSFILDINNGDQGRLNYSTIL